MSSRKGYAATGLFVVVGTVASFFAANLFRKMRLPPVLGMLGVGFVLRMFGASSDDVLQATDPIVDLSLAAMGLEIGSHLNEQLLAPYASQLIKFMAVFCPVVYITVVGGVWGLVPEMLMFAPLVASVALERSSPECLHGVGEARAKGFFSATLMCISAMMDVSAIVVFVISGAVLGTTSVKDGVMHIIAMLISTALATGCAVAGGWFVRDPVASLVLIVGLLATMAELIPSELLLSAISTGVVLNYRRPHASTASLVVWNPVISAALFTWMGYRVDLLTIVGVHTAAVSLPTSQWTGGSVIALAVALFLLRLFALFIGSSVASVVCGMRQHWNIRWLGQVTQLAIALSLAQRGERAFPEGALLMRAYSLSILGSLVCGPALLQLALRLSGEADAEKTAAAALSQSNKSESRDRDTAGEVSE